MTRMTNDQLVDENIALRHNLDCLEEQIAELTRQLVVARGEASTKYKPLPGSSAVVATYTKRDGTVWNKVRTGWNTYAHRPA